MNGFKDTVKSAAKFLLNSYDGTARVGPRRPSPKRVTLKNAI